MNKRQQARQRGHNLEYAVSKKVNGVVVGRSKMVQIPDGPAVQTNCQQPPDVLAHPSLSFETTNKAFPKRVLEKLDQAAENAPAGFLPLLWWYDKGSRNHIIVMGEQTFNQLLEAYRK